MTKESYMKATDIIREASELAELSGRLEKVAYAKVILIDSEHKEVIGMTYQVPTANEGQEDWPILRVVNHIVQHKKQMISARSKALNEEMMAL